MANIKDVKAKDIKITLSDGVERTLRYDLNALAEMEDRYGSVGAALKALENNSIKAVRFVLWAGLIHEEPGLTEQKVGSLIDMKLIQELVGSVGDAFEADMPEQDPNTEDPNV